jgi:hypothetical protein
MWSDINWQAGRHDDAAALMTEAIDHLARLLANEADTAPFMNELLTARFQNWQQRGVDIFDDPAFSGIDVQDEREDGSCLQQAGLVGQAILEGDLEKAQNLSSELLAKGYYEPGFIETCRQYNLCD